MSEGETITPTAKPLRPEEFGLFIVFGAAVLFLVFLAVYKWLFVTPTDEATQKTWNTRINIVSGGSLAMAPVFSTFAIASVVGDGDGFSFSTVCFSVSAFVALVGALWIVQYKDHTKW